MNCIILSLISSLLFIGNIFAEPSPPSIQPPAASVTAPVQDLLSNSFHIKNRIKLVLDGTEAASNIQQSTLVTDELVFYSQDKWRVRREYPWTHTLEEYLKQDSSHSLLSMTANNRGIPTGDIPDTTWLEVILAPLRLAQTWGLADGGMNFSSFLETLKSKKELTKASEGNRISLEVVGPDKNLRIVATGSYLQDGKTKTNIESTWEMTDLGKIKEVSLKDSLIKNN